MLPRRMITVWVLVVATAGSAPAQPVQFGDADGDVDLEGAAEFVGCLAGPGGGLGPGCGLFDFDGDDDVDLRDFAVFQGALGTTAIPMVLIPGGEFEMGDHHDGQPSALPVHAVYVASLYMDVYEVTNRHYADALNWALSQGLVYVREGRVYGTGGSPRYCNTTSASSTSRITWDDSDFGVVGGEKDHPMVEVTWHGAAAYANWRSGMHGRQPCYDLSTGQCDFSASGYRLPAEAEWEYAARGGEHDPYYRYPWGDDVDGSQANYWDSGDPYETGDYPWTTPVGHYDGGQTPPGSDMANGYGLYDIAGNMWEWCNDWYSSVYYSESPYDNPRGPASGTIRVLRGGSWGREGGSLVHTLRCGGRFAHAPISLPYNFGFRLVRGSE